MTSTKELDLPEDRYRERGYQPPFDELPWPDEAADDALEREASPTLYSAVWLHRALPAHTDTVSTALWVHENSLAPMDGPRRRSDRQQFRCTRTAGAFCVRIVRNGPGIGFQGLGADGRYGIGLVIVRGTVRHLSAGKPLDRKCNFRVDGGSGRGLSWSDRQVPARASYGQQRAERGGSRSVEKV